MAYVNVAEWKTEQVCEWLKGLENSVLPYVHSFTNHGVNGQQLLNLRPEDLEHLGVLKLGHQEIILEAVEYLRNFHYELDRENLQLLALRLSCQAHSLHNELSRQTDSKPVTTQTLSDVASVMMAVKPLVRWLDRPPFSGQLEYNDKKAELMKLALEMATCAQRDRFAEKPIEEIRTTCGQLAKLADYIIQEIADPMILQPASLDLATLKKKPGDDLGFYILPSFHGAHQIAEIKFGSAAHQCGKMEEGDEIVQVNYQTVVGWERKNLLELFRESPAEILLTLKRRPRHTKVYGQIYIKPYRLPSNKKTSYTTRWQHNLPSPRPELLTIPDFTMPLPRHMPKNPSPEPASILDTVNILDTMIIDSSDSDSEAEPPMSIRLYSAKPRNLVQRRATITGASPTTKHGIDIEQFWKELKQEHSTSFQLRDKAASCAHGLDNVPSSNLRPQTCLGIEQTKRRRRDEERKVQFQERPAESEVSLTDGQVAKEEEGRTVGQTCDQNSGQVSHSANVTSSNNASDTSVPLDECSSSSVSGKGSSGKGAAGKDARAQKERGKLDKSYSTPAYDLTDSDDAEDRRQMFLGHNADPTGQNGVQRSVADSQQQAIETREVVDEIGTCCNGNVARRISNIERQIIRQSDNEEQEQQRLAQTEPSYGSSVHDKAVEANRNGTENSQSNNESIIPRVRSKCETKPTVEIRDPVNGAQARPVADNHPEGTNGIVGVGVQSNDKHDRGHQPVERTEKESCAVEKRTVTCPSPVGADPKPVQNIPHIRVTGNTETSDQANDTVVQTPAEQQTPRTTELTRVESSRRPETKAHLTPPEPPPRKYFSKPAGPSTVETLKSQDGERLAVPERPSVRRDLKRSEFLADGQQRADNHQDLPEIYSNYGEKPIEYIDEPVAGNELCLEYGRQGREERPGCDRYEPFLEKFAGCPGQSQIDCQRCEPARNVDSPDGSSYGKQSDPNRSRTSEKDKSFERGVVNKAMMVARSIGLHGSLNKSSSSSPRSSRKRSILFARKRNVSVKDIGAGDLEGWLTYRSRGAGGAWAKAWFVLKCSSLYRFKSQSSTRADCLIALTGFTVSQAAEVKSRKYAFKVYHTGTVFYFAADTEDTLALWLEAISRATLGADSHGRNSALFSETDESDSEQQQQQQQHRTREKSVTPTHMDSGTREKSFGSLKKVVRKDSGCGKDHEMAGASLDRKYLRFLGTRNQNVPVPTAQFRSYRRVLPTSSTSTKKQDSTPNSPDLQMTIAGSTFYGLCASQSATDMSSSTQDMGDYRRTTDSSRCRRPDDLQGFITLEEFMLSQQDEERRQVTRHRSVSPRVTPLTSDHVHVQHRNLHDCGPVNDQVRHVNDVAPFGEPPPRSRATNDNEIVVDNGPSYGSYASRNAIDNPRAQSKHLTGEFERAESSRPGQSQKKFSDSGHHGHRKRDSVGPAQGTAATRSSEPGPWRSERKQEGLSARGKSSCLVQQSNRATIGSENPHPGYATHAESDSNSQSGYKHEYFSLRHVGNLIEDVRSASRRLARNDGYSGSSSDLTSSHASYETLQRAKKEASVSRKGSFNLSSRREHVATADRHWLDSLRRTDKRCLAGDKSRLKNVAQYQPPPMPSAPFEQEGMRAAFEMHLDKAEHQVQKANRLKSLFGSKYQQKPCTLDLPKDTQKTLLGSPRLHRAIFRDKSTNQPQQRYASRSSSQSPGDSGISQSLSSFSGHSPSQTLSQSFSSVSSASDWSPDTPSSCGLTVSKPCPKGRNSATPPTLPYIPPPTSPPPDYPGLEYPPVFEPGTYSLSDASLLRSRNRANQSANQ